MHLSLGNTIPKPEESGGEFKRYYITLIGEAERGMKYYLFRRSWIIHESRLLLMRGAVHKAFFMNNSC